MTLLDILWWASTIWLGSGALLWLGIVLASGSLNFKVDMPMLPCVMFLGPFGWYLYFTDQ